jgi:WD40 repeat protein
MVQIITTSERNGSLVQQREQGTIYHLPICLPQKSTQPTPKLATQGYQPTEQIVENAIVDIKWHPFKSVLSFATHESVFIYSTLNQCWFPKSAHGLTHEQQSDITCLAWKPFAAATIAVGSKLGVCLWRVFFDQQYREPSIHGVLPLINKDTQAQSWMIPYFVPGLENVECLCWSPDGTLLVVGYRDVPTLVVWDAASHEPTILSRGPKATTTELEFSHDGNFLLQSLGYS